MSQKKVVRIAVALAIFTGMIYVERVGAETTLERIQSSKSINLGFRDNSVPFSYAGKDGKPLGFSVELCRKIAIGIRDHLKLTKIEEKWIPLTAVERLNAVKDGKVDIECGNTTNTAERRKMVAFAIPTFIASVTVMSNKDKPINDYTEMSGRKVTALRNGTVVNVMKDRNNRYAAGINLLEAKDISEALQWLEEGKVEAWATDDAVLYGLRPTMKDPSRWNISTKRLSIEPLALAIRREDLSFEDLVNKQIRILMENGSFGAEYQRWFLQSIPDRNINLNLPMSALLRSFVAHPTSEMPLNY
jgi:ABC-type amino acid transport substrate-binding protein